MIAFYIFFSLSAFLTLFLPFATLLGFFGDREDGFYRFRSERFILFVVLLSVLIIVSVFVLTYTVGNIVAGYSGIAETAVAKNRYLQKHIEDNISIFFPEILNPQTEPCYNAAISNYIEDEWAKSYRVETCKKGPEFCSDNEQAFFAALRSQKNPGSYPFMDLDPIRVMIETIWVTARDLYDTIRSFQGIIDPSMIGKAHVGSDPQNYETYRQYFINCMAFQPMPWIAPDAQLITSPAGLCLGSCP